MRLFAGLLLAFAFFQTEIRVRDIELFDVGFSHSYRCTPSPLPSHASPLLAYSPKTGNPTVTCVATAGLFADNQGGVLLAKSETSGMG